MEPAPDDSLARTVPARRAMWTWFADQPRLVGTILALCSAAAFGTVAIIAKLGYSAGLTLDQLLLFRFLSGTPLMFGAAAIAHQHPLQIQRGRRAALLGIGALYAAQTLIFYTALRTLSASLAVLIVYSYPSLVALGSWLLIGKPMHRLPA